MRKRDHPLYYVWANMIQRCHDPERSGFQWYGAKGVSVCQRWRENFDAFTADMGERPEGRTLDRWPNKFGNYEPGNCRWATEKEQQRNRTNTKLTPELAAAIAAAVKAGKRNKSAVARAFGISRTMVRKIATGEAWQ